MVKVLPNKISVLPIFQFHVLRTFTIHVTFLDFYEGLTYKRPPWKHLTRSEKSIENNVPSWLYGLKKHAGFIHIYIYIYKYLYICDIYLIVIIIIIIIIIIISNINNELTPSRNSNTKFTRYYIIYFLYILSKPHKVLKPLRNKIGITHM